MLWLLAFLYQPVRILCCLLAFLSPLCKYSSSRCVLVRTYSLLFVHIFCGHPFFHKFFHPDYGDPASFGVLLNPLFVYVAIYHTDIVANFRYLFLISSIISLVCDYRSSFLIFFSSVTCFSGGNIFHFLSSPKLLFSCKTFWCIQCFWPYHCIVVA